MLMEAIIIKSTYIVLFLKVLMIFNKMKDTCFYKIVIIINAVAITHKTLSMTAVSKSMS